MDEKEAITIINIIKMPFVFIFYFLYILFTLFIPSKYVSKIINIEAVEDDMNIYINHSLFLKFIALLITIIIFIYFS